MSREHPTFEVDPAMVRVEFLGAHFKAPPVWREAAVGSKGLGHPRQRVQPQQVLAHSLWVPPSAWQDRVAEVQAGIDALKPWRTRTAAELDSLLPAILDQAFEGEF